MNDVILKADNLYYSYDDGDSWSLQGLSLEIRRGEKIALMGPNGSGKSTFFLCCNGILRPDKGTLYFDGIPYDYSRQGLLKLRQKVGIVFQDPDNQLFSASVYQEISFGPMNLKLPVDEVRDRVEEVISQLEIEPFRHKPAHALSGGQKKQVAIADILVMHPDIILLDEPAAALDPWHTAIVNEIVDKLTSQGITVLMATHDVNYALEWADRAILFKDGQVFAEGTPSALFSNRTILKETNLEQPAALQLFESLCKKGILKASLPAPNNLQTLERYISEIHLPKYTGGTKPMNQENKKAILVVSFGTSYEDTRKKTIDAIEEDIAAAYPQYQIYRAWTSKMIMAKLLKRDGIKVNNVREAMEQMAADGITDVIIQPTHVINGIENDLMKEDALAFREHFASIRFGTPMLTSEQDNQLAIDAITTEFSFLAPDELLVLMGHGTTHFANSIYAALDYTFKDRGFENIYLGTVEAYPSMQTLLKCIKKYHPRKVHLAPFMIVAGDHAKNDMNGSDPDSWRSQIEQAGYETECHLKGLGEYPAIRKLFISHIEEAISGE